MLGRVFCGRASVLARRATTPQRARGLALRCTGISEPPVPTPSLGAYKHAQNVRTLFQASAALSSSSGGPVDGMQAHDLEVSSHEDTQSVRVKVPLPTKGNTVFSLLPGTRLYALFQDIRREDPAVDELRVFDEDGNALAASTYLYDLGSQRVNLAVNDRIYGLCLPPPPSSSSSSSDLAHVNAVVERMSDVVETLRHQQEQRDRLKAEVAAIEEQLQPMEDLRHECQVRASRSARRLAWGGLAFLSLQFGFLARLTWWEYSWDLMEPVTYFVTIGTDLILFSYFVLTRTSFSPENVRERAELKSFYKLAQKRGMDVSQYNDLKKRLHDYTERLKF